MDILLTGASRGLGKALCSRLLRDDNRVWGVARDPVSMEELQGFFGRERFRGTAVDVSDYKAVLEWKDQVLKEGFKPECLIINASIQSDDMSDIFDAEAASVVIDVNLRGAFDSIGAFLPELKKNKGRIVGITSTVALRPSTRSASYAASKAGLSMALRSLRLHFKKEISIGEVCLGPIATEMWEGKKNSLVPSAEKAAKSIAGFALSKGKILYYPFLTTTLLRLSHCLPDSVFAAVSSKILK